MKPPSATTLSGRHVRLEPATAQHAAALWPTVAADAFRYMPSRVTSDRDLQALLARHEALAARREGIGFVQVALPEGEAAGHTGYWNVSCPHRRLEIGMTWLAPRWRRTAVNTEAKLLLLRHAFEVLGAERVEFKTDARNRASRAALRRLGAVEEGTLRRHMLLADGSWRDSVYYSVLAAEWPAVEASLTARLRAGER